MEKSFEIIIHGRGGQGAKTSAELIAQAATGEGKFVQAFPEFGPERSGAPVRTFARISADPIRTREPIVDPDCVLVLDDTLLETIDVTKNLTDEEFLIVNTKQDKKDVKSRLNFSGRLICLDASGIAMDIIGENRPNTVILGKFIFATETIRLESLSKAFKEKYLEKIGQEKTRQNVEAIEQAYDSHH
ncbi:MAG: 2-oxoacid:acceptor oxidoreductase family protein [Candidatus Moranbacteria bacterium]|nr:2-oxoacid:acceptor oxidoreductase family protein [Candidatus Moranbacteria bacterium]